MCLFKVEIETPNLPCLAIGREDATSSFQLRVEVGCLAFVCCRLSAPFSRCSSVQQFGTLQGAVCLAAGRVCSGLAKT